VLTPPTPATEALPTDVEGRLIQAATEIRKAEEQLRKARNRLDSAIYDAVRREGHQVAAVAIAAGVTRQTVYQATGRPKSHGTWIASSEIPAVHATSLLWWTTSASLPV